MLDIKFIRENKEAVKQNIANRQMSVDIDKLLDLDEQRRTLLTQIETLRAEQNKASEDISKEKHTEAKESKIKKTKEVKEKISSSEPLLADIEKEYEELLRQVPNMLQPGVPVGKNEAENVVLREVGDKLILDFKIRDYMEIAQIHDLIDTERGAKVSGSRFGYLKGAAAILEFSLFKFAMDFLTREGFVPVIPPVMIKSSAMAAMGYIDTEDDRQERYFFPEDDLYLVGTSEQSIGPMHADEIIGEKDLPCRYVSFSTCFRREAGSYGKDTKGILRTHQFDKLEMFSFCRPEDSVKEHKFFVSLEEKLMQQLELPYRVVQLCSADFARPSSSTIDIETWFPGENKYRETHSSSNCTDFQARRLNIRYKNKKTGKLEFVHMLNGTAFSQRPILAILENYQKKDGSVEIPEVLQKLCGFKKISRA
ncbi:MAG: serine--tRNA ligase [Candidatus Portnoybacteria bacterium RBG_19FT_COMBO_36_7]|uniref:Serine--tRNA ligase n=1 Tax=Candidatus Portnoybacteria bacterium RBG_19FT_COMBO_36_7 TaxID=1801992 RepID=A0A1G2F8I0_9BACT|nr:MAG: serine--tRNA ligase [Candidatus Portnoybacteria bacterium RBG_19FT_COMBO_36_7]